ncbi:MAG: TetR/AcrR family transcriptional regulator [Capsulimonadaceae bacterium]|nr:TetR/AcrR family transcriptional regulator [Capsulimonadaceae bacterium]
MASRPTISRSRDTRADRSKKLLQAAYELIPEVGIAGLRTRDITQKAGVHLATFHYCFESKNALLAALYDDIVARFHAAIETFILPHVDMVERLEGHRRMRQYLLTQDPQLLIAWMAFKGAMWSDPAVADIVRPHYRELRRSFGRQVELDAQSEAIAGLPVDNAQIAGALVIAMFDGALDLLWLDPEDVSFDEFETSLSDLYRGGATNS